MIESQYMRRVQPADVLELPEPSKIAADRRRRIEEHQKRMERCRERESYKGVFSRHV
jgi:hypothetical protein